ncbi:hypothetical protein [Clostridium guangxiense]|uniref:hypothetical protein n=1 Tax=Clostridium guangxiense TaxID=1662055 RepID=UPI001E340050|nr:hypothetical protein [Clostridium guangxiense]MCD2345862.1 hypothetical protein [Clostridium guangxiense]
MANILMIEPNYKCKYPPLGLMKFAYYHKEIRNDIVWFSKGELQKSLSPQIIKQLKNSKYYKDKYGKNIDEYVYKINEIIKHKEWDRVYVSTLFTFEYEETIKAIDYAKSLVGKDNVYTGGILATLMPEQLRNDTGVIVNTGQLTDTIDIGYNDKVNIDILTPDYSILDNTEYSYENEDAYYAYTTRGCGMNCGFCAVKTLEPEYKSFISIKNQISNVKRLYGEKKDLLLMDNNVLKSKDINKIINEILDLGFGKDATYINPKTNKIKKRFVDFNQGLDAFLITDDKARLLGNIAIKPARVAFDHIEDAKTYEKAVRLLAKNGVRYLSNYLLYNADSFSGKGRQYKADTPEDLYNRLKLNVDLQEELNRKINNRKEKVYIFSFPMRYIPLNDEKRGYVGAKWNKKFLRAVQSILIPTQGKGVSSKSFFEAAFGQTAQKFMETILMPEVYIISRGDPNKIKNVTEAELQTKIKTYNEFEDKRREWVSLYNSISNIEEKIRFDKVIGNNNFDYLAFQQLIGDNSKKLFIHYLTSPGLMIILQKLYLDNKLEDIKLVTKYIKDDFTYKYKELVEYMVNSNNQIPRFQMFKYIFGESGRVDLLNKWLDDLCENEDFMHYSSQVYNLPIQFLYILKWCSITNIIDKEEKENVLTTMGCENIDNLDLFNELLKRIFNYIELHYSKDESKKMINSIKRDTAMQLGFLI